MTFKKNCNSILITGGGLLALGSSPIINNRAKKGKTMKKELYREICFLFELINSLEIDDKLKCTIHKSINDVIEALKG